MGAIWLRLQAQRQPGIFRGSCKTAATSIRLLRDGATRGISLAVDDPEVVNASSGISVIVNQGSGLHAGADPGSAIEALFAAEGVRVRLERVAHGGDLPARARQAVARGDLVVAAGGDGTVNAVATAAVGANATFGVLPTGTLNHFAKDIGMPADLADAVRAILGGRVRRLDAGEVNGRLFINNSSIGIYPRMVWEREAERRRGMQKRTAFGLAMLRTWRQYRTFTGRLVVDGDPHTVRTPFIFVGNNEYVLEGLRLGARAALDAGHLSVIVAPDCGRFEILALPLRALAGRLKTAADVATYPAREVVVELRRSQVGVALDGEVTMMRPPLRYRIRPRVLRTIVPPPPPIAES